MNQNESTDRAEHKSVNLFTLAPFSKLFSKRSKFSVFAKSKSPCQGGEVKGPTSLTVHSSRNSKDDSIVEATALIPNMGFFLISCFVFGIFFLRKLGIS